MNASECLQTTQRFRVSYHALEMLLNYKRIWICLVNGLHDGFWNLVHGNINSCTSDTAWTRNITSLRTIKNGICSLFNKKKALMSFDILGSDSHQCMEAASRASWVLEMVRRRWIVSQSSAKVCQAALGICYTSLVTLSTISTAWKRFKEEKLNWWKVFIIIIWATIRG